MAEGDIQEKGRGEEGPKRGKVEDKQSLTITTESFVDIYFQIFSKNIYTSKIFLCEGV